MRLTVELMPEEEIALIEFAKELSPLPTEEAAAFAIREFLISKGYLDHDLDQSDRNDTEYVKKH